MKFYQTGAFSESDGGDKFKTRQLGAGSKELMKTPGVFTCINKILNSHTCLTDDFAHFSPKIQAKMTANILVPGSYSAHFDFITVIHIRKVLSRSVGSDLCTFFV